MKFFRCYLEIAFAICVLALLAGCASPLQKADKLAMSDPGSAVAAYEQIMEANPGSEEAKQAHLGIAKTYYDRLEDQQKGLEVYEEVAKAYPGTEVAGKANYAIGWHYYNAKDYEKAREKFVVVTKEMPGTEEADGAALAIARCYEELKKYEDAAKSYEEFLASHPQHKYAPQAGLSAAKLYERELDKTDEAIDLYKDIVSKYSFSSSGREARESLVNLGVDESEIADLTKIETPEEAQPEPETISQFGTRRRRRATNVPRPDIGSIRPDEEQEEQQRSRTVSGDFGVDPVELMPVGMSVDSQGTMYDAMFMMANMSLQSGEYRNAGALYERAIKSAGDKTWESAASAYFGLAKSYKGIGMDDKATEMFREAIKRDRKIIDRMIVSGETQYGEAEYEEALKTYETALGLVPHKDPEIYYDMGLVYLKLGAAAKESGDAEKEQEAAEKEQEAFERAVALKPNFADAVTHLAEVLYYRTKDVTRADLYDREARGQGNVDYRIQMELGDLSYRYAKVFSEEPDRESQSGTCYSWAKIKYGNAERLIKRKIDAELKDAIESGDESEAKQIMGDASGVTLKLVSEAAASGNQLASEALQKVSELLAESRYIGSRVAICNVKMNRIDQAQKQLDELKDSDPNAPDSAEFHFALGEIALAQGDKNTGLSEIKKALEINPEYKEAADRLKELEPPGAS